MNGKSEEHYITGFRFVKMKTGFLNVVDAMSDFERAIGKAARKVYGVCLLNTSIFYYSLFV